MASHALFQDIPPFPDDVAVMPMRMVSLAGLIKGEEEDAQCLISACQELGFFLLNLHGDALGEAMISEIDSIFSLAKDILNLPNEVKSQYLHDAPRSFLGFKPRGQAKTEDNQPDRFEWFNLGQDGLMGTKPLQPLPPIAHDHLDLFKSFLEHGQYIIQTISRSIAKSLSLPLETFTSLQTPTKPSGTVIRIIKAFAVPEGETPRTSMIHHTDFGTITLLANVVGGLQILPPGAGAETTDAASWRWVRPQPDCLIVNLGDAMVQWTDGLLRSNIHRINHGPGLHQSIDRYSVAILARAEHDASMRHILKSNKRDGSEQTDDEGLSAWEWEVKKAMALTRGEAVPSSKGGAAVSSENP
jgi:isopenicillin N synthase-like dioxygenase